MMNISKFSSHVDTFDAYQEWSQKNGWDIDTVMLNPGPGRFETDACTIGDITVWRHYAGACIFDQYAPPEGQVEFSFSILPGEANWCGIKLNNTAMVITRGKRSYTVVSPQGMTAYGVTLPESVLREIDLIPEKQFDSRKIPEKSFFTSPNFHTYQLFRLIDRIIIGTETHVLLSNMDKVTFHESIIGILHKIVHVYMQDSIESENIKMAYRSDLIGPVLDIFYANMEEPLTIANVALQLGVSRRTIEVSFQQYFGVGPYSLLNIIRLHGTRDLLKNEISVQDACLAFGFANAGRFAGKFKKHFGVLPSEIFKFEKRNSKRSIDY